MLDSSGDILPVQVLLRQYKEVYLEPSNYTAVLDDTIIAGIILHSYYFHDHLL